MQRNQAKNSMRLFSSNVFHKDNASKVHDGRTGQDLAWNMLNLISGVSKTVGGTTTQLASYNWYADGTKYSALRADGSGYVYKGGVIYEKTTGGTLSLDCVLTTGGRIVANKNSSGTITGYTVYHHITDHLGSVRAITNASTGNVVETSDFLPFGTRWSLTAGSSSSTLTDATNRWRYSGKEEQKALNSSLPLIDYGARMYDPTIARWLSGDPMAEKYYPMSPYGYCAGNPINMVDPAGLDIWEVDNFGRVKNIIPDNTTDSFYIVKETGDGSFERTGQSISFDHGTIKRIDPISSAKISFSLATEKAGAELFKFFADNTSVEFGFISTQSENSWVFSDQKKNSINIIGPAIAIDKKGEIVTTTIHSHPMNSFPSGYDRDLDESDKRAVSNFEFSHHAQVNHYVYQPLQSVLILYDSKSYSKFGMPWNTLY